jgi:hypothetical protein
MLGFQTVGLAPGLALTIDIDLEFLLPASEDLADLVSYDVFDPQVFTGTDCLTNFFEFGGSHVLPPFSDFAFLETR